MNNAAHGHSDLPVLPWCFLLWPARWLWGYAPGRTYPHSDRRYDLITRCAKAAAVRTSDVFRQYAKSPRVPSGRLFAVFSISGTASTFMPIRSMMLNSLKSPKVRTVEPPVMFVLVVENE